MAYPTLLHQWFGEVWQNAKESAIPKLLDDKAVIHGLSTDSMLTGSEAFLPFYHSFRKDFPIVNVTLDHLIKTEDFEAAYCDVITENSMGKRVQFNGICVARFKDGKLIEAWNAFDFLTMYQQLGYKLVGEDEATVGV